MYFVGFLKALALFGLSIGVEIGTDCGGKEFICKDASNFYACIDFGDGVTKTIVDTPQECPINTFCNDDLALECAGVLEVVTTKAPEVTTIEVIVIPVITTTETLPEISQEPEVATEKEAETAVSPSEPGTTTDSLEETTTEAIPTEPKTTEAILSEPETTEAIQTEPETTEAIQTEPETTEAILSEPETTEPIPSEPETTDVITSESPNEPEESSDSSTSSSIPETTSLATTPEPFECSISGKFPDPNDCRKFTLCIWTPFGYLKFDQTCAINLAYDVNRRECTPNQAPCITTGFKCEMEGRFADTESNKIYNLCIPNTLAGGFYQYTLSCSVLTIFDPIKQKCVLDLFPGDVPSVQTEVPPQPTKPNANNNNNQSKDGSNEELPFECVTAGTFAHPNDERRFIVCTLKKKDKLKKKVMKCKKTEKFDIDLMLCTDAGVQDVIDTDDAYESDEDDD
ncbi:unnamed protein product [Diamesa hyperborea]